MRNPSSTNTPNDGDFASYLEGVQESSRQASPLRTEVSESAGHSSDRRDQSIEDVIVHGEEPTDAFLEEWNAMRDVPELSEEELARQALSAPGDDGDPNTPE